MKKNKREDRYINRQYICVSFDLIYLYKYRYKKGNHSK